MSHISFSSALTSCHLNLEASEQTYRILFNGRSRRIKWSLGRARSYINTVSILQYYSTVVPPRLFLWLILWKPVWIFLWVLPLIVSKCQLIIVWVGKPVWKRDQFWNFNVHINFRLGVEVEATWFFLRRGARPHSTLANSALHAACFGSRVREEWDESKHRHLAFWCMKTL